MSRKYSNGTKKSHITNKKQPRKNVLFYVMHYVYFPSFVSCRPAHISKHQIHL